MSPSDSCVGYVEIDNDTGAYTYWCVDCVPAGLRQSHREVDIDEAERQEAECDGCGWVLADGPTP